MKAVVVSDSHKNVYSILRAVENEEDARLVIHAGDVQQDVDDFMSIMPNMPIEYVLGNNDYLVMGVPHQMLFSFGGKQIFLTHGHTYNVKRSLIELRKKAKEVGADICIFGHTHSQYLEQIDGIWFLNPGCAWDKYATIEIDNNGEINITLK